MKKLFMGFVTAALLTVCLCVPAFAAVPVCIPIEGGEWPCSNFEAFASGISCDGLAYCYSGSAHFIYCMSCHEAVDIGVVHTGEDCEDCKSVVSEGVFPVFELPVSSDSPGVLPSITTLVTAAINWLTAFALCILSTPLFLIFVCCIFVGLGIALIKRSIHL